MQKYSEQENLTWQILTTKRKKSLANEACRLYLTGLDKLQLPYNYIPDLVEINTLIQRHTKWQIIPTTKLITSDNFFKMLSNCHFPAITSIRPYHAIDFYTDTKPDVVHEYFGHGPFLANVEYSNFMQKFAQIAIKFNARDQVLLGRLFWFTVEFGLIETRKGLRAYGAGIIPSEGETQHALYSSQVERRQFNLIDVFRTPFSVTEKQKLYYVINDFNFLYELLDKDIKYSLSKAHELGNFKNTRKI